MDVDMLLQLGIEPVDACRLATKPLHRMSMRYLSWKHMVVADYVQKLIATLLA